MTLVAVYGSLRQGHSNHSILKDQRFLGITRTKDEYSMYSLGSYPFIDLRQEVATAHIVVELYDVDDECYKRLDRLEGYPNFYNRTQVELASGDTAWIYHMETGRYRYSAPNVMSGDWSKYKLEWLNK